MLRTYCTSKMPYFIKSKMPPLEHIILCSSNLKKNYAMLTFRSIQASKILTCEKEVHLTIDEYGTSFHHYLSSDLHHLNGAILQNLKGTLYL